LNLAASDAASEIVRIESASDISHPTTTAVETVPYTDPAVWDRCVSVSLCISLQVLMRIESAHLKRRNDEQTTKKQQTMCITVRPYVNQRAGQLCLPHVGKFN